MRLKLLSAIFLIFFISLTARLFYWQIVKGDDLRRQANVQYKGTKITSAPRGNILARDNTWLAVMRPAWLLYADTPNIKEDSKKIAESISPILIDGNGKSESEYRQELLKEIDRIKNLLDKRGLVWIALKHKITTKQKEDIEKLGVKGLGFEQQEARYYPEGSSSAHLLGFVGKNDNGEDEGYYGLEGYYNITLSGKEGYLSREKDLKGAPILSNSIKEIGSRAGSDLKTFIDIRVQKMVDQSLKSGIEKYGAKAGTVVVMDPKTGGILAMSSYPSYDPSKYSEYEAGLYRNPAISDTFEPGSVFKVIVMAAGLDSKEITAQTVCDICQGPLKVDKYLIETWDKKYYPNSKMTDVLIHSDNVGMSFIAQKLGVGRMYEYLDKFGIGRLTGIDLQGESAVSMRKKGTWNIVDLVTSSFGQGIAVTPIQIVRAVSAIANDGLMVTPKVVDDDKKPEAVKVISKEAANDVTQMMVAAAQKGEAKWTNLRGFNVAGKTGTAQIPIAGHYDNEKTIASFIGFAPAENPKFVMLVTLKEPQTSEWASETAAPLWYSIAKNLFAHLNIQPED